MTAANHTSTNGSELLDNRRADPALVRESLRNIARANAWFGGTRAAAHGVECLLARHPTRTISLLDVGTGAGDVPRHLVERLDRRGTTVRPVGVDLHRTAAGLATRAGIPSFQGDGLALPLSDRSVDVVLVSQVAHHLTEAGIALLVREASRVARIGVVISDLRRSRWAELGFGLASRLLRFDRATTVDGVTSLRRGFRSAELRTMLLGVGFQAECLELVGSRVVAWWSVIP